MPATEIKIWPGQSVKIPSKYVAVLPSDPYLTRKIKSLSDTVFLKMRKGRQYSSVVTMFAPKEAVEEAEKLAEASQEERAKKRKAARAYQAKRENEHQADMVVTMRRVFPKMPAEIAPKIVQHAFEVSSGRVGRTRMLDTKEKIRLAVVAYIRHNRTRYDELLANGYGRREAREIVAAKIEATLEKWKGNS